MPYVHIKLVKNQASSEQRKAFISGLTDLIVTVMGRDRSFTVITVDELDDSQWAVGGITLDEKGPQKDVVTFINIKVSKGTTNPDEIAAMMKAAKDLTVKIFESSAVTNYFIIDELDPDGWGFDGLSMTDRRKLEQ
jgi:4-oxalocrotonate tautomerase